MLTSDETDPASPGESRLPQLRTVEGEWRTNNKECALSSNRRVQMCWDSVSATSVKSDTEKCAARGSHNALPNFCQQTILPERERHRLECSLTHRCVPFLMHWRLLQISGRGRCLGRVAPTPNLGRIGPRRGGQALPKIRTGPAPHREIPGHAARVLMWAPSQNLLRKYRRPQDEPVFKALVSWTRVKSFDFAGGEPHA